jgi:hypothetical protein
MIEIDGQQYLLNDTTNHLLVVPATSIQQKVSKKAESLSPIDLAQDSFEEMAPSSTLFVTPSAVKKGANMPPVTTKSNVVLSKNNGSNGNIIYVAPCRKKRKSVSLPASQLSEKVQVIAQVELDLEVKIQDTPKTGRFGDYAVEVNDTNFTGSETVVSEFTRCFSSRKQNHE